MKSKFVLPGVRICEATEGYVSGPGTYCLQGYIYSSLAGELNLVNAADSSVSVEVAGLGSSTVVPAIGDVVTAKILSANPRFAKVCC